MGCALWESTLELSLNLITYKLFERRSTRKVAPKTYINILFINICRVHNLRCQKQMMQSGLITQKKCQVLPMDYLYTKLHSGSNKQIKTYQQIFSSILINLFTLLQNELGIAFCCMLIEYVP